MATVASRPTPTGLFRLLGLSPNPSLSGFQRAHIIGEKFIDDPDNNLTWLARLLGRNGENEQYNSVLLPEADRGSAILGTSRHYLNHIDAFDDLFCDRQPNRLESPQTFSERS